jgi:RimJ/RimL family protein N-acetyltransferase
MTNWIPYPTTLTGETVTLLSLQASHFEELHTLAAEKEIWKHYLYDGTDASRFSELLRSALNEREKGTQFPFVIFHKNDNRLIGSTRFMDIHPHHKKLEIGTTWIHPDYWGTIVNLECKFLLLTFCFEELKTFRVQLKTDENNIRSRKAIEKIGGQFEGIIRNDMVRDNHTKRNSALYSMIESEWPQRKVALATLLGSKRKEALESTRNHPSGK